MKKGNIEFKYSNFNNAYELLEWTSEDSCMVVAFFREDSEGFYMETVGDRFFRDQDCFVVGKHAIAFLNEAIYEDDYQRD